MFASGLNFVCLVGRSALFLVLKRVVSPPPEPLSWFVEIPLDHCPHGVFRLHDMHEMVVYRRDERGAMLLAMMRLAR